MQLTEWNGIGRDLSLSNGNWTQVLTSANTENHFYDERTLGMCIRNQISLKVFHSISKQARLHIEFINHNKMHTSNSEATAAFW